MQDFTFFSFGDIISFSKVDPPLFIKTTRMTVQHSAW